MNPDTKEITVNSTELVAEAEARLHTPGPPSDVSKFLSRTAKVKRRQGWWPEDKKIEVVSLYAAGVVSSKDLARLTGIPDQTIRLWRLEDWWVELLERVHASVDSDIVSKFTNIVDKSLEVVQDRLINGDFIMNKKSGVIQRRPVSMRDANAVATTVVDKRQLLRGKPTSRSEKISVDARLLKLAEEFSRFAQATEVPAEVKEINLEG